MSFLIVMIVTDRAVLSYTSALIYLGIIEAKIVGMVLVGK